MLPCAKISLPDYVGYYLNRQESYLNMKEIILQLENGSVSFRVKTIIT